jgi:hypothetical protein
LVSWATVSGGTWFLNGFQVFAFTAFQSFWAFFGFTGDWTFRTVEFTGVCDTTVFSVFPGFTNGSRSTDSFVPTVAARSCGSSWSLSGGCWSGCGWLIAALVFSAFVTEFTDEFSDFTNWASVTVVSTFVDSATFGINFFGQNWFSI